ncbi:MAG: hypothetical protein IT361_15765 [Gemmatimonadaceae bacterium]|nr:hypothetical protein [Gemmatimonadaceae bacterium]
MTHRNSLSAQHKRRRALAIVLTAAAVGGASGCDDPFGLKATVAVATDTSVAFAMTGTTAAFPSGFNAATGAVIRVAPDLAFDVAFDLTPDNKVRLIPARLISAVRSTFGSVVPTQAVGLQSPSGAFDAVTKAPNNGYKQDSVVVVGVGQPVVIQTNSDACQFSLASLLYAKVVVDSVNATTRQIFFRATRNPNCGFRSFQPGVPKD